MGLTTPSPQPAQISFTSSHVPGGHGSPALVQAPVWQVSMPVQNKVSSVHGMPSVASMVVHPPDPSHTSS